MTNKKKLEVIEEAFNYYHDRTSLNNKEEKELILLVNEIYAAISYTQRCVCKIPEPRLKVSENGTYAYCEKCAKTYVQI